MTVFGRMNAGVWRRSTATLLATSALTMGAPTMAQSSPQAGPDKPSDTFSNAPASRPPEGGDAGANQEIIVTATKRSESIQNVPISIQALGNATLEQHQVQSFDDYAKLLPSVSYQSFGPGQSELYFRGIATGGDGIQSGPVPGSGLYVDEIPLTTIGSSIDLHIYDMSRVEALSGPQGTLFGASSLSGTLRLITNQPDKSHFSAGYDLEGNKFGDGEGGGQAEGFVNVPLGDHAAIRLVGFYEHDGGYIDNTAANRCYSRPNNDGIGGTVGCPGAPDPVAASGPGTTYAPLTINNAGFVKKNFNDVDTYGGRAALKVDLGENWTATPQVIYQHQKANGTFLYDPRAGDLEVHDFTPDHNRDHWYDASLTIQGKLSNWDVTYAGAYFQRTVDNTADYSYFSVAYDSKYVNYNFYQDAAGHDIDPTQTYHANDHFTKMSHELRVNSPASAPLRLTTGLFLQRQTDKHIADYEIDGLSTAAVYYDTPVPGANPNDVYYTNIHRVDRDYAAFAEASYDILHNVTITGGIRGFIAHNTLEGFSGSSGALAHFNCTGVAQTCNAINRDYQESGETHKVNLTWKIDPTKLLYATYSTGFRPGGNNRPVFALGQVQNKPPFKADTLTNYEIGWKTSWLDHTLRINGALFWEDWKNVQYPEPGLLGIYYTVNAGKARSRGVEGDISWTIAHRLTLSGSGTYVDAKLTQDFCAFDPDTNSTPVGTCNPTYGVLAPKGTRLPVTPKLKLNATARYDLDIGGYKSFLQGTVNHQGGAPQYLVTADEAVIGATKGFTTFDFSAGTSIGNMTASIFIQNAFDKRGILSKNGECAPTLCGQYARLYPIKPQLFGVRFGQKF